MADETSILHIAETERDNAIQALASHLQTTPGADHDDCDTCRSLRAHVSRTEQQAGLLTPAREEALF